MRYLILALGFNLMLVGHTFAQTEATVDETVTLSAEVMKLHDAITAKKEAIKAAQAEVIAAGEENDVEAAPTAETPTDESLLEKAVNMIFGLFQ